MAGMPATCDYCGSPAATQWDEPKGTWCTKHKPTLWHPATRWLTLRCATCGKPGNWPNNSRTAVCRAHAPNRIKAYFKEIA